LKDIKDAIEARASANDHDSEAELDYLCGSKLDQPLRRLLWDIESDDLIVWIGIVAKLSSYGQYFFFSKISSVDGGFSALTTLRDAPDVIAQIAIYDPDDEVQSACLESLLPLMENGKSLRLQRNMLTKSY
jgi:hypothetical protein